MKNIVVANWKMHGSLAFIHDWLTAATLPTNGCEVVICPPLPYLGVLQTALPTAVLLGAQNVAAVAEDGAHTGEVSARMLAEAGCRLVLIGHSERRCAQHEDDDTCAAKIQAAAAAGLRPLLCVGESFAVRESGGNAAAAAAVIAQLDAALTGANDAIWQRLIIAYEPIWAIGSGKTPSESDIDNMHNAIRNRLIEKAAPFSDKIPLLYGGSVNAKNTHLFQGVENVNGFLVGGASLNPKEFSTICNLSISP